MKGIKNIDEIRKTREQEEKIKGRDKEEGGKSLRNGISEIFQNFFPKSTFVENKMV